MTDLVDLSYLANQKDMRSGAQTNPGRLVRQKSLGLLGKIGTCAAVVAAAGLILSRAIGCLNENLGDNYLKQATEASALYSEALTSENPNLITKAYEKALSVKTKTDKLICNKETYSESAAQANNFASNLAFRIKSNYPTDPFLKMVDESISRGY